MDAPRTLLVFMGQENQETKDGKLLSPHTLGFDAAGQRANALAKWQVWAKKNL